jgi:hypothetical protein
MVFVLMAAVSFCSVFLACKAPKSLNTPWEITGDANILAAQFKFAASAHRSMLTTNIHVRLAYPSHYQILIFGTATELPVQLAAQICWI